MVFSGDTQADISLFVIETPKNISPIKLRK